MSSIRQSNAIAEICGTDSVLAIPPRSLLYSLTAVGTGTPLVESFTSYLMRLAAEQDLTVVEAAAVALSQEREPSREMHPQLWSAGALNGASFRTERWVHGFELATHCPNLRNLTLLPFRDAFFGGIVSPHRAWCPSCLEEWRSEQLTIYEPLLWNFEHVRVCPLHNRLLATICPHCAKRLCVVSYRSQVGICQRCGGWLGSPELSSGAKERGNQNDLSLSLAIGGILEILPTVDPKQIGETLRRNVVSYIQQLTGGNVAVLLRCIPILKESVLSKWLNHLRLPRFETLVRVSTGLGIPLSRLFDPAGPSADDLAIARRSLATVRAQNIQSSPRRPNIRATFLETLSDPDRPSLDHTSVQFGCTRSKHCPETNRKSFQLIDKRHSKSHGHENRTERCARPSQRRDLVKKALLDALESAEPASLRAIAQNAGYSSFSSIRELFPRLIVEVALKVKMHRLNYRKERCRQLEEALVEDPPPSWTTVVLRTGVSGSTLTRQEPELASQLRVRYLRCRKKIRIADLDAKAMLMMAENPVPSVPEVCRRLGIKSWGLDELLPDTRKLISRRYKECIQNKVRLRRESLFREALNIGLRLDREGESLSLRRMHSHVSPENMDSWDIMHKILGEARTAVLLERCKPEHQSGGSQRTQASPETLR
jgi:hypothetical protein